MSALERIVRVLGRPLVGRVETSPRADAIVVLGSPIRPDGTLTDVGEERVGAGVALWKQGRAPLLCMTGGHAPRADEHEPEAEAMARRARQLGVPSDALLVEAASRFTKENAALSADLLRRAGVRRVIVVTQPFHLRRSALWFRRAGFETVGWHIDDSVQFRQPRRGLKWIAREYPSLARDLLDRL